MMSSASEIRFASRRTDEGIALPAFRNTSAEAAYQADPNASGSSEACVSARRQKPHSAQHLAHLRLKIQQPVLRSDGVQFVSIGDAAKASGMTRDQVAYSIRRGKAYGGFSFSRSGGEDLANQRTAKAVLRSDGVSFKSIADAARSVSASRPQIRYAIQHQRSLNGFTFSYDEETNEVRQQAHHIARIKAKISKKSATVSVWRSDGVFFPTLTAAAKAIGVAVSTVMLAVRSGRSVNNFTFQRAVNDSIEKGN